MASLEKVFLRNSGRAFSPEKAMNFEETANKKAALMKRIQ
jgi:hypothetical protein